MPDKQPNKQDEAPWKKASDQSYDKKDDPNAPKQQPKKDPYPSTSER